MPRCRRDPVDAERGGNRIDGALGRPEIEPAVAAEKIFRVEIAEHEIGVGDGRAGTALAVTRRSRDRPGAFRPDMQDTPGSTRAIEPPPAPMLAISRLFNAMRWPPILRFMTSAASLSATRLISVEVPPMSNGIRSWYPDQAGGMDAAGNPAGRSRQHGPRRQPSGLGDRRDAAMRLDDQGGP